MKRPLLLALGLCSLACGSTAGSGSTSAGTTSAGTTSAGSSGGTGGAGGAMSTADSTGASGTSSAGGAGGACHGDSATWATILAAPLDCQKNSDCCVVINDCLNEAQIVRLVYKDAAPTAWPYCDDKCTNCIPPAIQVGCTNGKCVGQDVSAANPAPAPALRMNHCGADPVMTPAPTTHFGCGG